VYSEQENILVQCLKPGLSGQILLISCVSELGENNSCVKSVGKIRDKILKFKHN